MALCLSAIVAAMPAAANERAAEIRGVTGFEDAIIVCGPGTDACYDSPEGIARLVARWKQRGYTGVYFRVSEAFLPERFSINWPPEKLNPVTNFLFIPPKRARESFDVLGTVISEGAKQGVDIWVFYPTVYSNGAPPEGPGFTQRWLYENRFGHEHPEVLSVDRKGNKHYQIWEYAYPEARQAKIEEFVYFAEQYNAKRIVACMRTEAGQMQPPPKHADQFGFNEPVVADMKKRYGVDILTDLRFDYESPTFDVNDPMLENWRNLRGEYLTQFYRELRAAMNEIDPAIEIAVQLPGERVGSCLGNWRTDWRTWIDEGLINEISYREALDNYTFNGTEHDPRKLGYLDIDQPDIQVIRDYIDQSKKPVRLIQAGGPSLSFESPPANVDGWRIDLWPELCALAMHQRWQQWDKDVAEFGHIKFLDTDFDDFPERDRGYGGGYGEFAHRPDLRRCPGYWFVLGDGTDGRPFLQSEVRRGDQGLAVKLERDANGANHLTGRHCSYHDRSAYPFWTDTAITTGKCRLQYWVLRPDDKSSLVCEARYHAGQGPALSLLVAPGDGAMSYWEGGKFVPSQAALAADAWHCVTVDVDLEAKTYTASVAAEGGPSQLICRNIPYQIDVNALNIITIAPQGETGSSFYVDDVAWHWTPQAHFVKTGDEVLLDEGFETVMHGATIDGAHSQHGATWKVARGTPQDVQADRTISYGDEYRSLRFLRGRGAAIASAEQFTLPADGLLTVNLDILPRSDKPQLYIEPTPGLSSPGETGAAVVDHETGSPIAAVRVIDGEWHCWTGDDYKSTNVVAALDVFSKIQMAVDVADNSYRVSIQVMGEASRALWEGRCGGKSEAGRRFKVQLESSCDTPQLDGPAMDNLLVTHARKE